MDRKKFFKNLVGASIATVIGNKLDFIPTPIKPKLFTGIGVWEQLPPERLEDILRMYHEQKIEFWAPDKNKV